MSDWLVQLTQGTTTLYLPLKGLKWAYTLIEAGHFSFKDALSRAKKQRSRFNEIMDPQNPPPAGLMIIKILEVDINNNILSEQVVT